MVGVLILLAYSMLIYPLTQNKALGFITDIFSGLAVIGIPLLMFPLFNSSVNRTLNYLYLISRLVEGMLMIAGGFLILISFLEPWRDRIYSDIHIYFFISGAIFFYILLYRTKVIPRFISVWGLAAALLLLIITILRLFGINSTLLDVLLAPMILNELFLAIWLIIRGFKSPSSPQELL